MTSKQKTSESKTLSSRKRKQPHCNESFVSTATSTSSSSSSSSSSCSSSSSLLLDSSSTEIKAEREQKDPRSKKLKLFPVRSTTTPTLTFKWFQSDKDQSGWIWQTSDLFLRRTIVTVATQERRPKSTLLYSGQPSNPKTVLSQELSSHGSSQKHTLIQRNDKLRLPLQLTPQYWKRHRLSFKDVLFLLHTADPSHVLLLALHEPGIMQSVPTVSFSQYNINHTSDTRKVNTKQSLLSKLEQFYRTGLFANSPPEIEQTSAFDYPAVRMIQASRYLQDSAYPFPVHCIDSVTFAYLDSLLCGVTYEPTDQGFEPTIPKYNNWISFLHIACVPLRYVLQRELMQVSRVLPFSLYIQLYGEPSNLLNCPRLVYVQNECFALLDETFYVFAAQPKKEPV